MVILVVVGLVLVATFFMQPQKVDDALWTVAFMGIVILYAMGFSHVYPPFKESD